MEQSKMPSAWELAQEAIIEYEVEVSEIENTESLKSIIKRLMITHTKLHVEAALKAASEKVVVKYSLIEQPTEDYVLKETGRRILFDTSIMLQ